LLQVATNQVFIFKHFRNTLLKYSQRPLPSERRPTTFAVADMQYANIDKHQMHRKLTPFLCHHTTTEARRVDSAESGVLPGRNDVAELVATAHSSCENCLLCASPTAASVYCPSPLLSSAVARLSMTAAPVLQRLLHQRYRDRSNPNFPKLQNNIPGVVFWKLFSKITFPFLLLYIRTGHQKDL